MLNLFITYLSTEKRLSLHSIVAYENDVSSFLSFVGVDSIDDVGEISYQNIRAWIVELINEGCSNKTVNRKLSSLRGFFKWLMKGSFIAVDPMQKIKGPKQHKRIPEFVKEEEIDIERINEVFPDSISGLRDRLILEVFYQTGIRLSELINLRVNDVNSTSIKVLGKRNKERLVPLSGQLYEDLLRYIRSPKVDRSQSDHVFLTDKGDKMYPNFVYRKMKFYLSLLTNLSKRSPHILRHTFATHMLNNGAGLETLKEILGHADLSATQIYTHNSFDEISKIYDQAHPRGGNE
ncbi:integrase [Brumimicrobium salinarum]|uniref:Integrase n=1 Tax=Brumimicrobium salinarum TaxID=2058658 RepID=A0A2I0R0K2_9FLAO|nr:tyrosine-type recombinase/integrase [Brumimicrobium salinarum]PKR80087.1 integrase [Brumimicrobium salinarum]